MVEHFIPMIRITLLSTWKYTSWVSLRQYSYANTTSIHNEITKKKKDSQKRLRWKAYFYLHSDNLCNSRKDKPYGLKSRRSPSHIPELKYIVDDLDSLTQRKKIMKTCSRFLQVMKYVIRNKNLCKDIIVDADDIGNMYKVSHENYDNLVSNIITKNFWKA